MFDAELGAMRREAGIEMFETLELPEGFGWLVAGGSAEPQPSIGNQFNPPPGRMMVTVAYPEDRPISVWMNELDTAIRDTGLVEAYKFDNDEHGPCDTAIDTVSRTYQHTETKDLFRALYLVRSDRLELSYTYTSSIRGGSFDYDDRRIEPWDPPACPDTSTPEQ